MGLVGLMTMWKDYLRQPATLVQLIELITILWIALIDRRLLKVAEDELIQFREYFALRRRWYEARIRRAETMQVRPPETLPPA